ncbi:MAG TPA: glycoside hydrolase family 16 protein [Thermomicrobiales bacterium]|nr:glycoside hydrolase family 16 protein [Thermomicrobiales bacterium]
MRARTGGAGWRLARQLTPLVLALLVGAIFATSRSFASATTDPRGATPAPAFTLDSSWRLVFDDEFDGTALDRGKWHTQYPWGRDRSSVGELQWYADDAFTVQDGLLHITAEHRAMEGHPYTSGLIASWGNFATTYGYFEIRAKLPAGRGLWPAFWLSPADYTVWPPEIDVFEVLGQTPGVVAMTTHFADPGTGEAAQDQGIYLGPNFADDFHTFAVEWTPTEIVWYIDGVERFSSRTGVPSQPLYLIANLAVGGPSAGKPDASTPFPSELEIDYIRVYQQTAAPCAATPAP